MGSGETARQVPCKVHGKETELTVISSHNVVQIGQISFNRDDLLVGIELTEEDLKRVHGGK